MKTKNFENNFPARTRSRGGKRRAAGDNAAGATPLRISFPWQRERARRLHRVCTAIESAQQAGKPLRVALRYSVRSARHAHYRSEPSRAIHLSRPTIIRAYYTWRKHGRNPHALALGYRSANTVTLTPGQIRKFTRAASAPGVRSVEPAIRQLAQALCCSARTIRRKLPAPLARALRGLHRARAIHAAAERAFQTAFRGTR